MNESNLVHGHSEALALPTNRMAKQLVISDAGIDDLVALALLDRLMPGECHSVVSTFGNAPDPKPATTFLSSSNSRGRLGIFDQDQTCR